MYLKALELRGFKSFPDKTRLEFQKGITAVVGPNGSGKSNVSDAVRWVLGEMSPKSLRGSKMEDVIFAGTAKRTQTGFCEVSIIIDNSDSSLACETEEVKITRKYYRSGDSEYRINDKPSRLRDIYELFLNTGIGREGYSVIGQGKIAEVISQKSDERRHIFEEAAGISKFRYRKNDAEKKLAETDANMIRLTDIAGEIELRLSPLEKDAENAKKFLVLSDRKKQLEVSIWLDKINKASEKSKQLKEKCDQAKQNYDGKSSELDLLDAALEGLNNKRMFTSEQAENTRNQISSLEDKKHSLENQTSLSNNDISHHKERKNQLSAQIKFLSETELISLKEKLIQTENQVDKTNTICLSSAKTVSVLETQLENNKQVVAQTEKALDEKQTELFAANEILTTLKIDEAAVLNSEKSESERADFLNAEIKKADEELALAYTSLESAEQRKKDFLLEKQSLTDDISTEQQTLSSLTQKRDELSKRKNELDALLAADTHRREVLDRMDKMLEGYPGSVKAVMNEESLSGICGPVSRILTVSGQYVTAIETALGSAVSNIVVEDEESAKSAITYLKRTNSGRATFLPLTSISSRTINEQGLSSLDGYIGVASELVSFDKKYTCIAENLLGRTVVADNIDNASKIARKYSYRYRIVTLDGQIINSGGSYTGGSASAKTGVMSRSTDIAELEESIANTKKLLSQIRDEIISNKEDIDSTTDYIESLKNDLTSADSGLYRSDNDIKIQNEHIAACSERLKNMHLQLEEFDSERIKEKLSGITQQRKLQQDHIQVLEAQIKELEDKLDKADQSEKDSFDALNNQKLSLVSSQKDYENACATLTSIKNQIADNVRRTQSLIEENEQIEKQLSGISIDIEKLSEELEVTSMLLTEMKEILESQIALSQSLEQEMTSKRDNQKEMQKDKEIFFEQMTKLQSSLDGCNLEYDNLIAKLWEEYTLTFTDALSLGYPSPTPDDEKELSSVKSKIKSLGHINVNAVEEYKQTKERYDFMTKQISDLTDAKKNLENIIKRLESDMKTMFTSAVEKINESFKQVFTELFGGGTANVVITDPENVLESGIEINVQPPGKMVKSISLLSGGEQAFTAIALYFAILKVNPAPFYIFDEIEAALDDVNVNRFASYVKKNSDTQFIIITHRRGTMEIADTMYGVTMQEKGVSSFLKVNIDDVEKKTGIKL